MSGGGRKELVEEERMKEDIEAILCLIVNYFQSSYMTCNFTHCVVISAQSSLPHTGNT